MRVDAVLCTRQERSEVARLRRSLAEATAAGEREYLDLEQQLAEAERARAAAAARAKELEAAAATGHQQQPQEQGPGQAMQQQQQGQETQALQQQVAMLTQQLEQLREHPQQQPAAAGGHEQQQQQVQDRLEQVRRLIHVLPSCSISLPPCVPPLSLICPTTLSPLPPLTLCARFHTRQLEADLAAERQAGSAAAAKVRSDQLVLAKEVKRLRGELATAQQVCLCVRVHAACAMCVLSVSDWERDAACAAAADWRLCVRDVSNKSDRRASSWPASWPLLLLLPPPPPPLPLPPAAMVTALSSSRSGMR
jgi:hypothetical protein